MISSSKNQILNFSRCGFSLVEIILVVLILSVIAGLTVPNFNQTYKKIKLQKSADDLAYTMRYAQSRAIIKGLLVRLNWDVDTRNYWLEENKSSEDKEASFKRFSGRIGKKFNVPAGVSFETDCEHILFYPDGSIEKKHINVCSNSKCFVVSAREQRGHVNVFEIKE